MTTSPSSFVGMFGVTEDESKHDEFWIDPDRVQTICARCGQPFTYPEGCTPTECLEGK